MYKKKRKRWYSKVYNVIKNDYPKYTKEQIVSYANNVASNTIRQYSDIIERLAYRISYQTNISSDDIYQELCIAIMRVINNYRTNYEPRASLKTYIYRALLNTCRTLGAQNRRISVHESTIDRMLKEVWSGKCEQKKKKLVSKPSTICFSQLENFDVEDTRISRNDSEIFSYIDSLNFKKVYKRSSLNPESLKKMLKLRYKGYTIKEIAEKYNYCVPRISTILRNLAGYIKNL